jgi:nitrogen-specific signal transduction histidine kinase
MTIADDRPGMSAGLLASLFDPTRVASAPRSTRSTGFGPYLSQMVVEANRGLIDCTNRPVRFTTVMISFPAARGASARGASARGASA